MAIPQAALKEAALAFVLANPRNLSFQQCSGGFINKVYCVTARTADDCDGAGTGGAGHGREASPSAAQYIIRIYNNGFNKEKVVYEHTILKCMKDTDLPFLLPKLVPCITDEAATFVQLGSCGDEETGTGPCACCFELIPGREAVGTATAAFNIGKAAAQLVDAMKDLKIDLPLVNPPFRDIWKAHSHVNRDRFFDALTTWPGLAGPDAPPGVKEGLKYLSDQVLVMEKLVERCASLTLPEQQIHADLHSGNVLTDDDGHVTGVLDFEFSTIDWRVLELCIAVSKYVSLKEPQPLFEAWVDGYAAGGGSLTADEASLVPDFLVLRHIIGIVYFVGRVYAGEDEIDAVVSRAAVYAQRIRWVYDHRGWIDEVVTRKLVAAPNAFAER